MVPDYKIPLPSDFMGSYTTALAMYAEQMRYQSFRYNYDLRMYEDESQSRRIRDLESKLEAKERKRENDLQSIIGYFYARRPQALKAC